MKIDNFFAELKRRNVIRMAGLYLVGAWLLTQVASTVFPTFDVPSWALRGLIVMLVLGFVPVLIFSWAFELTPQGLKRDAEVPAEQSIAPQTGRRLDRMIIVVLVLALAYFGFDKFVLAPRREAALVASKAQSLVAPGSSESSFANPKSIAVLPLKSLSEDKNNAYFADGIQDEILARLGKIADLKVISRTSTQKYKSAPDDLREIAQRLGVANILEGSVQKANDQVRVTVQLINALNDSHLWTETYDRKLIDVLAVESDIAQKVATALEAKLTGREKEDIQFVGTKNPQAYDALLHALALRNSTSMADLEKQIEFSRRAVELDPNYTDAWALLALAETYKGNTPWQSKEQQERARIAAETALRLAPNSANAHKAMGAFYRYCRKDDRAALAELEAGRERAPNDGEILMLIGALQRAQGEVQDALATLKKAADVDPLNAVTWIQLAETYAGLRQFDEAQLMADRVLAITPNDIDTVAAKAGFYQAQGDLDAAERLLAPHPFPRAEWAALIYFQQSYLRRDYDKIIAQYEAFDLTDKNLPPMIVTWVQATLGNLNLLKGRRELAAPYAENVRTGIKELQARNIILPETYRTFIEFAARLGNREEVENEVAFLFAHTRANQWLFPSSDYDAARGYAVLNDLEKALPLLQDSLSKPNGTTAAYLRLDPAWDGARNDPRFQKLIAESPMRRPDG